MSEQHIRDRVDSFFNNIKGEPNTELSTTFNEFSPAARTELQKVHNELGDEDYDKFAAIASKDERINAYLPGLAIVALSPQTNMFNRHVDRDGSAFLTKSEIVSAAVDSAKFDPIYRKALQYAVDNFDKLRGLDKNDALTFGNSGHLTLKDMHAGKVNFSEYRHRMHAGKDMRFVLENFDKIDANGSGKITESEVRKWAGQTPLNKYAFPKTTGRMIGGSEELSKADYAARIEEHERNLAGVSSQLGLK